MSSSGSAPKDKFQPKTTDQVNPPSKAQDEPSKASTATTSTKRKSNRNKKVAPGKEDFGCPTRQATNNVSDAPEPSHPAPARSKKKRPSKREDEGVTKEEPSAPSEPPVKRERESPSSSNSSDGNEADRLASARRRMEDPFDGGMPGAPRGLPMGLGSSLRAFTSMMPGHSSQFKNMLESLRQKDSPSTQLMALEELSNILLISNEDNLSGQFSTDQFVKELVTLMQPNEVTGEENPDIMLLACRSIANLMEAMRNSVAHVVHGGAVPVLCLKLLDIQYIDVAEQALSTLSRISVDYPAVIVREGGLTACLQFLDFFATGTQRTAVTTAANCCRNISLESFPIIRDDMPILLNVLSSHDQKVVEQGCLCVTRVVDSYKREYEKLEELVQPDLLRAILRLLLPGTTNLIGANIHTEFLKVLATVARASPKLSVELFKMNVVDTLYQILTGVSPPSDTQDVAAKIESVVVMQALIHRPREQVYESLNVICELLPDVKGNDPFDIDDLDSFGDDLSNSSRRPSKSSLTDKRIELLKPCANETRRFAMILLPTLTDAYSSTVNLMVRQKVLSAQLKMLSNLDSSVIEDALRPVPYASFLASILSQQDDPSLVISALQAAELLFGRLQSIYQYQFYREGVIAEIKKLADRHVEMNLDGSPNKSKKAASDILRENVTKAARRAGIVIDNANEADQGDDADDTDSDSSSDEDDVQPSTTRDPDMDDSDSSDSSVDRMFSAPFDASIQDFITLRAKQFLDLYETSKGHELCDKAEKILSDLQQLAKDIRKCYLEGGNGKGHRLFARLAKSFDGDALESITSAELLNSGIIQVMLDVLTAGKAGSISGLPQTDFLTAFVGAKVVVTKHSISATPLGVLVQKLQDLLSRSEHFEVLTVNHSPSMSSSGNATSMLSKQLRLKLMPEEGADIPQHFREVIVSIHAIATFKALDDYLRPKIGQRERPDYRNRPRDVADRMDRLLQHARMHGIALPDGMGDPSFLMRGLSDHRLFDSPPDTGRKLPNTEPGSQPLKEQTPSSTPAASKQERPSTRKSSRKAGPSSSSAPPLPPPPPPVKSEDDDLADGLECADEKHISDEESEGEAQAREALDAIVDDFDDEMDDSENIEDPSAVNLEFASTGKVTAHKEDGTRVATPQQPGTPSTPGARPTSSVHPSAAPSLPPSLAFAGRPYGSYAAALSSVPQDWHIEFSIDGKTIPKETTIYRAIYKNRDEKKDPSARNMWSTIHSINFKKVKGPPPEPKTLHPMVEADNEQIDAGMPESLNKHSTTSSILSLLSVLHALNSDLATGFQDSPLDTKLGSEPLAQFINTKLTAKLNRQLEEPLIVASNCLPSWSEDLARVFPFLFPFETRHLFLQSTSFGYSRSMMRWQSTQPNNDERRHRRDDDRPIMGRLQRQKVRISRARILESAMKVMELYGASPSVLEVEYFEEVGTGLGPTLEFYSTVSKEFSKKRLNLWRENESVHHAEYAFGKLGLFPAPLSSDQARSENGKRILHLFKILGKFVARSMLDSRIIDISFNPTFFRISNTVDFTPSLGLVRTVDDDLARSLAKIEEYAYLKRRIEYDTHLSPAQKVRAIQKIMVDGAKIEDLMLDFTLPGYPTIDLITNGSSTPLTIDNVDHYIERVLDLTLGTGVQRQIEAFQNGFSQVFPYASLRAFTPDELVMLFGRVEEDWSIESK